jgi:hypothetical protein
MNPLTIANAVANGIVIISVAGMAIRVFGDATHQIHQHRELFWIRKFISSLIISGAVLNLCTLSTPNWTETLLNYGFATNYLFSLYYHDRFARTPNSKDAATLLKRGSSSGTGGPRKTATRTTASRPGRKRPSSR